MLILWIAGALFTIGFLVEPENDKMWRRIVGIAFLWPFYLGCYARVALLHKKSVTEIEEGDHGSGTGSGA